MSTKLIRRRPIIERASPVMLVDGFPLDQLDDFLANGPQLGADRKSMAEDVRKVRAKLGGRVIPSSE